MQRAILFHDGLGVLAPLTDLRPAWAIRTGALRTKERLERALRITVAHAECDPALADVSAGLLADPKITTDTPSWPAATSAAAAPSPPLAHAEDLLFINARCPLPYEAISSLRPGESILEATTGHLVAARGVASDAAAVAAGSVSHWTRAAELPHPALLSRPWHVKTFRDRCLAIDLALLAPPGAGAPQTDLPGVTIIIGPANPNGPAAGPTRRLAIHPTARIYPTATFDLEGGPIVIDEHAVVRPGALIIGPAYIGPCSTVLDKALIKPGTAVGPHCKIAGEVGGTIFQGFTNKAHDGHLGDSYIGEWANLGAGTTNSNLLNTYGEVIAKAVPGGSGSNERTGEQFLGCIVGDHVKFAISTRIMTGAVIHTGTMWAASAPVSGCVPGFSWVTDAGTKPFRLEKFLEVMRAAMGRRKVAPSAAYLARVGEVGRGVG